MHKERVASSVTHQFRIDLKASELSEPLSLFFLLPHRCPDIGYDEACTCNGLLRRAVEMHPRRVRGY